jgi:hypothetical protein
MSNPAQARQRFLILVALRFGGVGLVMLGLAIARGLIGLPWAAGAVIAVAGILAFFILPRLLARRWNAADDGQR